MESNMNKIKYCPKCKKAHDVKTAKCSCGYDFIMVENVDATLTITNTKVIVDNTPLGLWKFLSFITLGIFGIIGMIKWKEDYPARSDACKKGAISSWITIAVLILLYVLYLILDKNGKIV